MKIQYFSDLHLEFPENADFLRKNPIEPKGDVLILAGDIVPFGFLNKAKDFFKYISDHFETTFWIPGNHEYYHYDLAKKNGKIYEKIKNNIFLVNNYAIELNGINFIFSTLWSKINPAYEWQIERSVNDFQLIKYNGHRFSVNRFNDAHEECLDFIKDELKKQKPNTVVATHHVPTFMNYPKKYKGDVLNEVFAVELFDVIEKHQPSYWIFGHHHSNLDDFEIGKTRLTTNQLGYVAYGENISFALDNIVEIK